jgi:hypothetical protein
LIIILQFRSKPPSPVTSNFVNFCELFAQIEKEERRLLHVDHFLAEEQRQVQHEARAARREIDRRPQRLPPVPGGGERPPEPLLRRGPAALHDDDGERRLREDRRVHLVHGSHRTAHLFGDAELLHRDQRPGQAVEQGVQPPVLLSLLSGVEAAHPVSVRVVRQRPRRHHHRRARFGGGDAQQGGETVGHEDSQGEQHHQGERSEAADLQRAQRIWTKGEQPESETRRKTG